MGKIPLVDMKREVTLLREEIDVAIGDVLCRGDFIMGKEVYELERRLCEISGAAHCIGVSSGTDALLLALMALDIGMGDEVITTPFTWVSSAEVASFLGADVKFVDIDPNTFLLDANKLQAAVTDKTKAIIPVSLFGQMPDMIKIRQVAGNIPVIEDGAQSFGAERDGSRSCGADHYLATTSFFPTKPLSCYGDGGAIFTSSSSLATKLRSLRLHGKDPTTGQFQYIGMNARLDTLQAAILLVKLNHFQDNIQHRIQTAQTYHDLLQHAKANHSKLNDILLPPSPATSNTKHIYAVYTIRILSSRQHRDNVQRHLRAEGITTAIYYPLCVHQQPAYTSNVPLPHAEQACHQVLSLPMHIYLTYDEQCRIINTLIDAILIDNNNNER